MVLLVLCAGTVMADTIVLTNGNVLHGTVEQGPDDTLYLVLPKGRVAITEDLVQEWQHDAATFEDLDLGRPEVAGNPDAMPTLALRPRPRNDAELEAQYAALMEALAPILLRPQELEESDLQMEDEYIRAIGSLGPAVAPRLEAALDQGEVLAAPALLRALGDADPGRGIALASDFVASHVHPEVRAESVALLAQSGREDRDALIAAAAQDAVWYVRSAAYEAMLEDWTTESIEKALAGLEDEDPDVREMVQEVLEENSGESFDSVAAWRAWVYEDSVTAPAEDVGPAGAPSEREGE